MSTQFFAKQRLADTVLRIAVVAILAAHSIPGMFDNGVNNFGKMYLDTVGFAPFGIYVAWAVKLSHVANVIALIMDKYVIITSLITMAILVMGVFMVHLPHGWFVVGGGSNGVEFNILLIAVLAAIVLTKKYSKS